MITREEVKDALNAIVDDEVREHQRRWVNQRNAFPEITAREFPIPVSEEIQTRPTDQLKVNIYQAGAKRGMVRRGLPLPMVAAILEMPELGEEAPQTADTITAPEPTRKAEPTREARQPTKRRVTAKRATKARVTPQDGPAAWVKDDGTLDLSYLSATAPAEAPAKDPKLSKEERKKIRNKIWFFGFNSFEKGSGKQLICAKRFLYHSFYNTTSEVEGLALARSEAEALRPADDLISA